MSTSWVASLQQGRFHNWRICKAQSLWGTGSASGKAVQAADELFVWQSGDGWLARCVVAGDAAPPSASNPAPWTDGSDYKYVFPITVVEELSPPKTMTTTNNVQDVTRIPTVLLGRLSRLEDAQAARCARSSRRVLRNCVCARWLRQPSRQLVGGARRIASATSRSSRPPSTRRSATWRRWDGP